MMKMMLMKAVLAGCVIVCVFPAHGVCFSRGASVSSCVNMKPGHISSFPQHTHSSVTIRTSRSVYLPQHTLTGNTHLSIHSSICLSVNNSLCVVLLSNGSEFPGVYGVSAAGSLCSGGQCDQRWVHAPPSQHTHTVLPQPGRHRHTLGQDAQEEPVLQLESPDTPQRRPALLVRKTPTTL